VIPKCKIPINSKILIRNTTVARGGPYSSVGIVTGYGLDGPGIESRWKRDFPYRVFPGSRKRPGRDADPSPPSSSVVSKQSRAIPLLCLRAFVACRKGEKNNSSSRMPTTWLAFLPLSATRQCSWKPIELILGVLNVSKLGVKGGGWGVGGEGGIWPRFRDNSCVMTAGQPQTNDCS
jgi:hypothetical protein